jgi:hypothetical protein
MKYVFAAIAIVGIFAFAIGLLQFCWQQVAVAVFGAPDLTFWQTAGLMILVRFVFNNISKSPSKEK